MSGDYSDYMAGPSSFVIISVNLSGTTLNMSAANAGDVVGAVTVTTNPPGGSPSNPILIGGPDAGKFALTNGGVIPCNLVVGASNLPSGDYQITLSST
jgi:hypothetical protein